MRFRVGEAVVRDGYSYSKAMKRFGVSRGFVSHWARVYRARLERNSVDPHNWCRMEVFESLSNRPHTVSHPVQDEIRPRVIERRRKYPFEGSFRIKAALGLKASPRTVDKVLRAENLLGEPLKRHVDKVYGRFERPWVMCIFQTDYKQWNTGIHTIWVMDDHSRFILGHRVVANASAEVVIELMEEIIGEYGNPAQILTDHGTEFYSVRGGKGRSKLDVWCKEHGIEHIMGRVRHPQTQGKMERSHRSAKEEILTFGSIDTLEEAQVAVTNWVEYYNWDRPHQALDYKTPGVAFLSMHGLDLDSLMEA